MIKRKIVTATVLLLLVSSSPSHSSPSTTRNPFLPVPTPTTSPYEPGSSLLERYPLESLKLTAIVRDSRGNLFASVEDPHGVGSKVIEGTRLGNKGETVSEVHSWGLVLKNTRASPDAGKVMKLRQTSPNASTP